MAPIGQLVAGVAHEINNPIGYVNSNLGSLGQYVEKLIVATEAYERAESDLSASSLLEEIRSLKRESDWEYLKQDVRDLLRESAEGIARVKQIVQGLKDFSHVDQAEWQGIIEKHHGRIEVGSEAGSGATFWVWLPVRRGGEYLSNANSF